MSKWKLTQWSVHATDQIIYPPDHDAVQQELRDHLEDKFLGYTEQGLSEDEAVERTLSDMGSAKELAPILGQIHRPFWGYACAITGMILKVLLYMTMFFAIRFLVNGYADIAPVEYLHFDPFVAENAPITGTTRTMVDYWEPESSAFSDGYWFSIEKASQWHFQPDGTDPYLTEHDSLFFHMKVTRLPWLFPSEVPDWLWAVDSEGNHYYCLHESPNGDDLPNVLGYPHRTGLFTYTYDMWISYLIDPEAEWIDLHYDRSGRNIILRIDLKGGETE